jgi:hypothetical protein
MQTANPLDQPGEDHNRQPNGAMAYGKDLGSYDGSARGIDISNQAGPTYGYKRKHIEEIDRFAYV